MVMDIVKMVDKKKYPMDKIKMVEDSCIKFSVIKSNIWIRLGISICPLGISICPLGISICPLLTVCQKGW